MSHLRVIAGEAKGRRLKLVPGEGTRPITDRVKEALFNILGPLTVGSTFLDLFAGTGSVGIEALSRGALRAVLVDREKPAIRTIHENLDLTRLAERAEVVRADSFDFLGRSGVGPFDFVYVAPPQYQELWSRVIQDIDIDPTLLNPDAWVIAQIDPTEEVELELSVLRLFDRRQYGSTVLLFYEFRPRAAA
ncbi:MAG: 16S rRNA (guanine(966)-N(2))-methyltransferase RsmD [Anaerolineales bacterium]